jgi:Uma2 family endonuclease
MNQPYPENISLVDFLTWEQQQTDRFEWIDGIVVPYAGGSAQHSTIIANMTAIFHAATSDNGPCFVQTSDRRLIPRNVNGQDLGSFYADLFVTCAAEDLDGDAAHFPTLVIEVLSPHIGDEFTRKKTAYLGSGRLIEYIIIDSTRRYVERFAWKSDTSGHRRLVTADYQRGPVPVPTFGLSIAFDQIYAKTKVPAILHPILPDDEEETEIILDL